MVDRDAMTVERNITVKLAPMIYYIIITYNNYNNNNNDTNF